MRWTLGLALLLVLLSSGPPARASGEAPSHHGGSILFGGALSALETNLSIDGRRMAPSPGIALDLETGYFRELRGSPLAVGAILRGGTFHDQWANAVGEARYRVDLRLVLEASWLFAPGRVERPSFTASVAFGPTVAWILPPERTLVIERYDSGMGEHAAVRLGLRLRLIGRHVGYYAIEGAIHRVFADRTAHVRGTPPHVPSERYRFQDHTLGVVVGYALSL